jgi:hypothetical protein
MLTCKNIRKFLPCSSVDVCVGIEDATIECRTFGVLLERSAYPDLTAGPWSLCKFFYLLMLMG